MPKEVKSIFEGRRFYVIALVLVLPGIVAKFFDLGIDPPQFFDQISKALLTDPYNLTYFARNKVLFGEWDIFDYPRWIAFKYSLSSGTSFIFFSLFGVSRITANLSAVFLNLAGLAFFLFGIRRNSNKAAVIAALILIPNMVLTVYGRHPFLENGLIFLCGLLYFLFDRYYSKKWILPLTGFLVALCMISGKMFGIVMIVPAAVVLWMDNRRQFPKSLAILAGTWIISLVVIALIFYGHHIGTVIAYLQEQTTGMYGLPEGFKSPRRLIENMLTFGSNAKLYYFAPFFLLSLFAAVLSLVLRSSGGKEKTPIDRQLLFNLGWLVAGYLFLMISNYRPLRYQLFLLMPAAGVISIVLSKVTEPPVKGKFGWARMLLLFYICWYFGVQTTLLFFIKEEAFGLGFKIIWLTIPIWAVLAGVLYHFRGQALKFLHHGGIVLSVLTVIFIVNQYRLTWQWFENGTHAFRLAGRELAEIVGDKAVIIGPYAQSLTIDNNLKSFIYMFGMARKEPTLFAQYPFTHLAIDGSNREIAFRDYPGLKNSWEVSKFWAGKTEIDIFRISHQAPGAPEPDYQISDYERAFTFLTIQQPEKAYGLLSAFLEKYPRNRPALLLMPQIQIMRGKIDEAFAVMDSLMSYYPDDFSIFFNCAFVYYRAFLITGSEAFGAKADSLFDRSVELNPYFAEQVKYAKQQAAESVR